MKDAKTLGRRRVTVYADLRYRGMGKTYSDSRLVRLMFLTDFTHSDKG